MIKKLFLHRYFPLIASLLISFSLFSNNLNGNFIADDKLVILQNPLVNGSAVDIFKAFGEPYYYNQPHAGLYRPVTVASYALNRAISAKPFGFHEEKFFEVESEIEKAPVKVSF